MKISNKLYDILKWLVIIVLPAAGTLYAALSTVWGWPHSEEIVTTITAVDQAVKQLSAKEEIDAAEGTGSTGDRQGTRH